MYVWSNNTIIFVGKHGGCAILCNVNSIDFFGVTLIKSEKYRDVAAFAFYYLSLNRARVDFLDCSVVYNTLVLFYVSRKVKLSQPF